MEFEPHKALFVSNDDPMIFYKAIVKYADQNLKHGGKLYFEINPTKAREVVAVLKAKNYREIVINKDLHGKERMVKGIKAI